MEFQGQRVLDRYLVGEVLGEGGGATVCRAEDLHLGRPVAIKFLRPELRADTSFVTRFEWEARAVAQLEHPNIVSVYDYGEFGGTYFLVMQYVPAGDLRARLDAAAPLPIEDALRIGAEVAEALGEAHWHGIVHRDVKPANILLTADGHAKVSDFGIAKILHVPTVTTSAVVLGTVHYLAPEQASNAEISPATDVYSLGVVLYEMLTGRPPFVGETYIQVAMQHLNNAPPPLSRLNRSVPPRVAAIVERALAKDPAARFPEGRAIGAALWQERRALPATRLGAGRARTGDPRPSFPPPTEVPQPPFAFASAPPAPKPAERPATEIGGPVQRTEEPHRPIEGRSPPPVLVPGAGGSASGTAPAPLREPAPTLVSSGQPGSGPPFADQAARAQPSRGDAGSMATDRPVAARWPGDADAAAAASPDRYSPPGAAGPATMTPARRSGRHPLLLAAALAAAVASVLFVGLLFAARPGGGIAPVPTPANEVAGASAEGGPIAAASAPTPEPTDPPAVLAPTAEPTAPVIAELTREPEPEPIPVAAPVERQEPPVAPPQPAQPAPASGRVVVDDDAFGGGFSAPRNYRGRTARWVYGALSPYGEMAAAFTVSGSPRSGNLTIVGIDSENGPKTPMQVLVNDTVVFSGANPLPKDPWTGPVAPWSEATFPIPPGVLREGRNTITIRNRAEVSNFNSPPYIAIDQAIVAY